MKNAKTNEVLWYYYTHVIMASLDSWLLHTEETNNTGDETESDESEPQPRQAKVIID